MPFAYDGREARTSRRDMGDGAQGRKAPLGSCFPETSRKSLATCSLQFSPVFWVVRGLVLFEDKPRLGRRSTFRVVGDDYKCASAAALNHWGEMGQAGIVIQMTLQKNFLGALSASEDFISFI